MDFVIKGECIFHPVVRSCAQHPNLLTLVHHLLIVKLYFFIFFLAKDDTTGKGLIRLLNQSKDGKKPHERPRSQ